MALTITQVDRWVAGDRIEAIFDITFDSAYPAGGEAVAASDFRLTRITHIQGAVARNPQTHDLGFVVDFDSANSKLVLLASDDNNAADSPLLELSGLSTPITDVSAYTARVRVTGKG